MAEFSVNPNNLLQIANDFPGIAKKIEEINNGSGNLMRTLKNYMSSSTSISNNWSISLRFICSHSKTLGNILSSAASEYSKSENNVKSKSFVTVANQIQNNSLESNVNGADEKNTDKKDKSFLDILSKILKAAGKGTSKLFDDKTRYTNSTLDFGGDITKYVDSLIKMINSDYTKKTDTFVNWLSLLENSTKVETGFYKFFENVLHPYQASKLYDKFNGGMNIISVLGSLTGFAKEGVKLNDILSDAASKWYDKTGQLIDFHKSGLKTIGDVYITTDCSSKVMQIITKPGNQILATEGPKLSFSSATEIAKKAKEINGWIALGDAAFSSISSGIRKYGECMEDGQFTFGDAGSTLLSASCSGLSSVISGLISFYTGVPSGTIKQILPDPKSYADYLEAKAIEFANDDNWAANYIRDENNNIVLRYSVSFGSGAYIIGKEAYEGWKIIGDRVSSTWNKIFN